MKRVPAHIKVNASVYERLKGETEVREGPFAVWPFIRGYEVRIDPTQPDDMCELVEAHTIKPFLYMRLGSQFWWGDTLYVNPRDERLLP